MLDDPEGTFYPCLFYDDALGAIDWLKRAFGFQQRFIVRGDEDRPVRHSELALGMGCIIVVSTVREMGWVSPIRLSGTNQSLCVYVPDVDPVYEKALLAGAEVIVAIEDTNYGARQFTVRDPEGHTWTFGNYRPGGEWK